jgi:hypothetical protein
MSILFFLLSPWLVQSVITAARAEAFHHTVTEANIDIEYDSNEAT